jgi:hypothetical protein
MSKTVLIDSLSNELSRNASKDLNLKKKHHPMELFFYAVWTLKWTDTITSPLISSNLLFPSNNFIIDVILDFT